MVEFANSIAPDETAHNELPHLDLDHLFCCSLSSQYDITWTKFLFLLFAGVNFVICFCSDKHSSFALKILAFLRAIGLITEFAHAQNRMHIYSERVWIMHLHLLDT